MRPMPDRSTSEEDTHPAGSAVTERIEPLDAAPRERRPTRARRVVDRLRRLGGGSQGLIALLAYLLFAILIWGVPVVTNMAEVYVGKGARDPQLYVWSLAWWPHAVLTGTNPLVTEALWAPRGVSLAWVTALPGPALAMTPVTRTLGPVVSLNTLMLLAPTLSAWGGFLVCRRVTTAFWPSLAGGYIFGFSTYQVGQQWGHLNLGLTFCVPLAVYLVLRRYQGDLKAWWFVPLLALALAAQFSISTEVFASMTVFGGLALAGALALVPGRRRMLATIGWIAAAYVVAAALVSPFLIQALREVPPDALRGAAKPSSDLLSFVLPRFPMLIGGQRFEAVTERFTLNWTGDGAYLGPALLVLLIIFAAIRWRHRSTWLLLGFAVLAAVLSMGPVLHILGRESVPLPWALMTEAPLIENALPQRFVLYMWLAIGVIVAIWLAGRRWAWARWVLVVVAAVMLLPDLSSIYMHGRVSNPTFFTDGTNRRNIRPGEVVLTIPLGHGELDGRDMHWQAITDFHFRLADGHIGFIPEEFQGRAAGALRNNRPRGINEEILREYLARHRVSVIVVPDAFAETWREPLSALEVEPVEVGGVVVYRLPEPLRDRQEAQPRAAPAGG
jgi:hypothetical protein